MTITPSSGNVFSDLDLPTPPRWQLCPSTHCERSQECREPHECCVKPLKQQLKVVK